MYCIRLESVLETKAVDDCVVLVRGEWSSDGGGEKSAFGGILEMDWPRGHPQQTQIYLDTYYRDYTTDSNRK